MKYIKYLENYIDDIDEGSYIRLSNQDEDDFREKHSVEKFSKKCLDLIEKTTKLYKPVLIGPNIVSLTGSWNISIYITQHQDDWFIVSDRVFSRERSFLCDGIDGLIECIKTYG